MRTPGSTRRTAWLDRTGAAECLDHRVSPAEPSPRSSLKHKLEGSDSSLRLGVMVTSGIGAAVIAGLVGVWGYSALIGWDTAALIFTAWVWLAVGRMDARMTASHATRESPSKVAADFLILVGSLTSLVAVGFVLVQSHSANKSLQGGILAGLAVLSVALSWTLVHTLFALRYAKLYYTGKPGGVNFNEQDLPRYSDFAYLAFTVGMTFQVSDTNLVSRDVRSTVLHHALLSYLFGTVIVASTINLIAGL